MSKNLLKPWSISTAVRNPERLRGFLSVLSQLDGEKWNHTTQISFQIRLIQARHYGVGNRQFYSGLSQEDIQLLEDNSRKIPYERAEKILLKKCYEDPPMRGRNSFKPLQKFGFALIINGNICITESGRLLISEQDDYGEVFLRALLKWQLPNTLEKLSFPEKSGYNIKPFVGTLRLIHEVNQICEKQGLEPVGLSRFEFNNFGLTLIDWRKIRETAQELVEFRKQLAKIPKTEKDAFAQKEIKQLRGNFDLKHLNDYGDNALRYFRMTKYIRLRGMGNYIDLEPIRHIELTSLFQKDNAQPIDEKKVSYTQFLADAREPTLPGETKEELISTVNFLQNTLRNTFTETIPLKITDTVDGLKRQRDELRAQMQFSSRKNDKEQMQNPAQANLRIQDLRNLLDRKQNGQTPSLKLERLATLGLDLMNDAEKIKPNYPLGDDGEPTNTAPAGKPDIECFYRDFAAICEVTMMRGRQQWVQEAQPVMRHLHEFKKDKEVCGKPAYCLFIAPSLHQDSLQIFRFNIREGYEGDNLRIVPITLEIFCMVLDFFKERAESGKAVKSKSIKSLFDAISCSLGRMEKSSSWLKQLPELVEQWKLNT